MGLDGVELVMALEEAFGVDLEGEEIFKAVTPGLVTDLIYSTLRHADQKTCQTQRAFYILRKACTRLFHVDRKRFAPDTPVATFTIRGRETIDWPLLQRTVEARRWPKLVRPRWLVHLLSGVCLSVTVALVLYWWRVAHVDAAAAFWLGCACGGVLGIFLYHLTKRARTRLPARIRFVRDIVPYVSTAGTIEWTREQVAQLVKVVVQEQLGVSDAQYREDAHFVNDFGMD